MIELPRACFVANRIAKHADFFSFGTNDLTQTALGFSRDDVESAFVPTYIERKIIDRSPFETIDTPGVGWLVRLAAWVGREAHPGLKLGICGEHGGDPDLDRVLPPGLARLRLLLPVPHPDRPDRGRAGRNRASSRALGLRRGPHPPRPSPLAPKEPGPWPSAVRPGRTHRGRGCLHHGPGYEAAQELDVVGLRLISTTLDAEARGEAMLDRPLAADHSERPRLVNFRLPEPDLPDRFQCRRRFALASNLDINASV